MHPNLYALGAIALWASLASLGVALKHVPPFLLTGLALVIGSVPATAAPMMRAAASAMLAVNARPVTSTSRLVDASGVI